MMSQQSKRELLDTVRARYRSATRSQKSDQIDGLVAITGYHRKYLIHLLAHPSEASERPKRRRKRLYTLPAGAGRLGPSVAGSQLYLCQATGALHGGVRQCFGASWSATT